MKTLLTTLNAKYIHSCLALYTLKAFCPMYEGIFIREFTINQERDKILREIVDLAPDLIGFSCYIWNIEQTNHLIRCLKQILPNVIVITGGPEPCDAGDVTVIGEGEQTFLDLISFYTNKQGRLSDIAAKPRPPIEMTRLIFPYQNNLNAFQHRILYYETSRGCPFQCEYCLSGQETVRFLPLERVYSELNFFLEQKAPQVKFVDRTFNCSKEHAMGIWRYIIEHDNGITRFHCEIAADLLDGDALTLLDSARADLFQFEIGVQTVNTNVLKIIRRKSNLPKLFENVRRLKFHRHLDLIAGLPGETFESFQDSFNQTYALGPEQLQLGFLKLLKGTMLRERAEQLGIVYDASPPYEVLKTPQISYQELSVLKGVEEILALFYNSRLFVHTLQYEIARYPSPFSFYADFSAFWRMHGYQNQSHGKFRLFEILWEFCGRREVLLDYLRYDLFIRENEKNPPEWLVPRISQKEKERRKAVLYRRFPELSAQELASAFRWVTFQGKLLLFCYTKGDVSVNEITE